MVEGNNIIAYPIHKTNFFYNDIVTSMIQAEFSKDVLHLMIVIKNP